MLNRKILTMILIPMLLITTTSYCYAHVRSVVIKKYKLHIEFGYIDAESYKLYSPYNETITEDLRDGTLYINASVFPCWYAWIGLVIKNNGIFSMRVDGVDYQFTMTPPNSVTWNATEFYYGPYKQADFNRVPAVWKNIKGSNWPSKLDPDIGIIGVDSVEPPIYLEPPPASHNKCKAVVWIYLHIIDCPPEFSMDLSLIVRGTITDGMLITDTCGTYGEDPGIPIP